MSTPNAPLSAAPDGKQLLRDARAHSMGFLSSTEVKILAKDHKTRLFQLLVRFHGCRLTAAAQDVAHIIELMEKGGDCCRDVSIPAGAIL